MGLKKFPDPTTRPVGVGSAGVADVWVNATSATIVNSSAVISFFIASPSSTRSRHHFETFSPSRRVLLRNEPHDLSAVAIRHHVQRAARTFLDLLQATGRKKCPGTSVTFNRRHISRFEAM